MQIYKVSSFEFSKNQTPYDAAHSCEMLDIVNFGDGSFGNSGFSSPRINLSPFTKDFRGEEQYNESIDSVSYTHLTLPTNREV